MRRIHRNQLSADRPNSGRSISSVASFRGLGLDPITQKYASDSNVIC